MDARWMQVVKIKLIGTKNSLKEAILACIYRLKEAAENLKSPEKKIVGNSKDFFILHMFRSNLKWFFYAVNCHIK